MLRDPDLQLLSALTRAECILVVADLRHALSPAIPAENCKAGWQGHNMARAAQQWLQEVGLQAELCAETVVMLRVNNSKKNGCSKRWAHAQSWQVIITPPLKASAVLGTY